jgi:hypothetical protein
LGEDSVKGGGEVVEGGYGCRERTYEGKVRGGVVGGGNVVEKGVL